MDYVMFAKMGSRNANETDQEARYRVINELLHDMEVADYTVDDGVISISSDPLCPLFSVSFNGKKKVV